MFFFNVGSRAQMGWESWPVVKDLKPPFLVLKAKHLSSVTLFYSPIFLGMLWEGFELDGLLWAVTVRDSLPSPFFSLPNTSISFRTSVFPPFFIFLCPPPSLFLIFYFFNTFLLPHFSRRVVLHVVVCVLSCVVVSPILWSVVRAIWVFIHACVHVLCHPRRYWSNCRCGKCEMR